MKASLKLKSIDFQIIWSTFARYGGQLLMAGISVITVKLLTGFFDDVLYSEYLRIIEYVTFFNIAANLGMEATIIRHMADNPEDGKTFANALMLRMVTATGVFLLGLALIPVFVEGKVFVLGALIYFSFLFFEYVTSVCKAMLQAHYLMGRAMAAVVLGKVLYATLVFLMVRGGAAHGLFGGGVGGEEVVTAGYIPLLYVAPMIGGLLTMVLCLWFVRQKLTFEWKKDFRIWRELLITGLPFGIINILNGLYFRTLPHLLANEALPEAQFGNFNLQFRIAFMLSLFSTALMLSVMPALKHALTEKKWEVAKGLLRKSSRVLFALGVVLVGGVSWLGPWLIEIIANKKLVVAELWFVFPMFLGLAAISYFYDLVLIALFTLDEEVWFLKMEVVALTLAGLVFGGSYFLLGAGTLKLVTIIAGALVGEGFIVVMGMRKLNQRVKNDAARCDDAF